MEADGGVKRSGVPASGMGASPRPEGERVAVRITIRGRVQGVGFRPFVARLADRFGVFGSVQNNMDGVFVYAEGSPEAVQGFVDALPEEKPRAARIYEYRVEDAEPRGEREFRILPSDPEGESHLVIPVDMAVCEDCLREMRDPTNRRYRYPFISCTQCGPRYTIIESLPYDRERTTMRLFPLCEDCRREYEDPADRRYHAETTACAVCGPSLILTDADGRPLSGDPVLRAQELLREGKIVAVKGIGGFHLACDATREDVVQLLRARKHRPRKPLAVMVRDLAHARRVAELTPEEESWLTSAEAPIVIAWQRPDSPLAPSVAPRLATVGIMLPYSPLHHLLLEEGAPPYLVMTSANPSGLPILYRNEEAYDYLRGIADAFLLHNRPIVHPLDDSVLRVVGGDVDLLRRSRGFVPEPIFTHVDVHGIVGMGSEEKNTFAFGRHRQLFVGPHIGDMGAVEVEEHYLREFEHLFRWMGIRLTRIAVDMHPLFTTRRLAQDLRRRFPEAEIVPVQHHHAHLAAAMGEHHLDGEVYGLILDGTGYGTDGAIWGFEVLYGGYARFRRIAHLRYAPLPGGDRAVREPWRTLLGMLYGFFGAKRAEGIFRRHLPERFETARALLRFLAAGGRGVPLAGTCGRLFDAVSALLGLVEESAYDGEPAIVLSELIRPEEEFPPYTFAVRENAEGFLLDPAPLFEEILRDFAGGVPPKEIAGKFHAAIVRALKEVVVRDAAAHPERTRRVVLSGGCFHNPTLRRKLKLALESSGFEVFTHRVLPAGDGGLSAGQVFVARYQGG
ncbi:carbamoyltransferase HypF [Brockia lithotrophica]|uniref:Carbamoyltransferase n=1 Tax=Brockia lithotrophica TaxID=933949 RepID=A0A660LAC3_9BACL|nr:carbamoyltransferase HypF [Brockia lithotrophica]RKQ88530.1 hydrogenase maturation protein HypF [Brockia lithotrophica]